jgi:integrase
MPKLTFSRLRALKPGHVLADDGCDGLRFIGGRDGRLYAQLRVKAPHPTRPGEFHWVSRGLGRFSVEERMHDIVNEEAEAGDEYDEQGRPVLTGRVFQLDEVLEPLRNQAFQLKRRLLKGEAEPSTGPTFARVAQEYMARHVAKLRPRSRLEYKRAVERFVAAWGSRPMKDIARVDIVRELDRQQDKHGPTARNRAHATLGSLYTFALKRGSITDISPVLRLDKVPERPRERWLRDDELARLWRAFDTLPAPWGPWARLLALTGQRREQVATMRWEDVHGLDGAEPVWLARQKGDRALLVPLAPMAAALLRSLGPAPSGYVFPSGRSMRKGEAPSHIRGYNHAILGVEAALEKDGGQLSERWTWHDLRRTLATGLSRLKVPPHIREAVLGHAVANRMERTYNQWDYADEKRAALDAWEQHLEAVLAGGNVLPLSTARQAG